MAADEAEEIRPLLSSVRRVRVAAGRGQTLAVTEWPGRWRRGAVAGLDLGDLPGDRHSRYAKTVRGPDGVIWDDPRRRNRNYPVPPMLRQPKAPEIPTDTPEGPREFWHPMFLELPMYNMVPKDAWWFPAQRGRGVPSCWFVPHFVIGTAPGFGDPQVVYLVWIHSGRVRRPWAEEKTTPTLPSCPQGAPLWQHCTQLPGS